MPLGQSFEDADELLTLIALLPVMVGLLFFASNMNNPEFNGIETSTTLLTELTHAFVPNIELIIALGLLLWLSSKLPEGQIR
jgi:hypothetical protein